MRTTPPDVDRTVRAAMAPGAGLSEDPEAKVLVGESGEAKSTCFGDGERCEHRLCTADAVNTALGGEKEKLLSVWSRGEGDNCR